MGKRWKRLWRDRSGEGYVDMVVLVLCGMLVLALCVQVLPVFVKKQQLDVFATELVREAEITGRVGTETSRGKRRYQVGWRKKPTVGRKA